ncbi:MAG: dihydroxyacetone kinase phosphoryl donor subunit DhaM [Gammaproteobacteria bacterium]|nr:dihydroxyacetone kinase phosphoryl donor subunit DhaM [Gammaproteobacteria bacterium]
MNGNVALVIVSHSRMIARGTADMVAQMVGSEVTAVPCGGDPAGGLGTSVAEISDAIRQAFAGNAQGVLVIVDLGGAETNSEMAIEMLPEAMQARIQISDAPIVEGAIMAAAEASSGAPLSAVGKAAEEVGRE